MAIKIQHVADGFTAVITGSDGRTVLWQTEKPLSESELMTALRDKGEDQRDVFTALHQSDPSYFGVGKW